jgi:hypothetical protein
MKRTLVTIPRLPVFVATAKLARVCPRCRKEITEGQSYLRHSEGDMHSTCLRVDQKKRFAGEVTICQQ